MIEAILYAAIGFFVAALLGLFLMSLLWQRAVRLTTARVEASAPTTLREMTAIRDALRAENAISLCRMEQGLEKLRTDLTVKTIGYRGAQEDLRLIKLELDNAQVTIRELEQLAAHRQQRITVLEDNLSRTTQALKDASRAMRETESDLRALEQRLSHAESLADTRKVEIAALKARAENQQSTIQALETGELKTPALGANRPYDADAEEMEKTYAKLEELQSRLATAAAQAARREQQMGELEARLAAYEEGKSVEDASANYLRDKLATYAAELAGFAANVEGPNGKLSAMIAQQNADEAGAGGGVSLAERIRLIAGKTSQH